MTYPWFSSYESGVAHEIDPKAYNSIVELFDEIFEKFSDRPAFSNMGTSITYKQLDQLSRKFASYLQNELGLKKGERVAIMLPNTLQYPVALFGILRAAMVVVNVNPLYTAREIEHTLKDSDAKAIVIFANSAAELEKIYRNTNIKQVIVTRIGDRLKPLKGKLVNFVIRYVKKMEPAWKLPGHKWFNEVIDQADEQIYQRPELSLDDVAFLQYTGGTTGVSKGATLSHGNIVANIMQAKEWIKNCIDEKDAETIITALPLYHIFSLTANCFIFSSIGSNNILITNPRDIPAFIKELKKWKFTAFTGVNTLFNALLHSQDFKSVDFSSLKLTLGGGMAVQKAVAEEWKKVTGRPLIEAYGLTETSPAACINPMNSKEYNGYIGLPISSTVVSIKDDQGHDLEFNKVGEICIKGPQVMRGYWNRPEETALVMTEDGFFRTGDMGYMTPEGYFKIVDRKKDMILVSGFNVYPNEVEDVLCMHKGIVECAAVGVVHEKSGEVVKLFVVRKDHALSEDDIISYARENLTSYKVPKFVEFREELPKSNVGKILRRELR